MTPDPTPILIGFTPDQFLIFIITIVGAAVGAVVWVYKLTHPLDVALTALTTRVGTLERSFSDREREFRNTETESIVNRLLPNLVKNIMEKMKEEGKK
jgi:hypothetical protein